MVHKVSKLVLVVGNCITSVVEMKLHKILDIFHLLLLQRPTHPNQGFALQDDTQLRAHVKWLL